MRVILYKAFKKKHDSTKNPSNGKLFECELKGPCTVLHPVLTFRLPLENPTQYNYCFLPDFNRFYYIGEWSWELGIWSSTWDVDPLATWKTFIGNSSQYVLRASAEKNGALADSFYPITAETTTITNNVDVRGNFDSISDGYYVLGVIANEPESIGGICHYVFSSSQFRILNNALLGDTSYLGSVTDISDDLLKVLYNPFQFISTCRWYPFKPTTKAEQTSFSLGWWTLPVRCAKLASATVYNEFHIEYPRHFLSETRGIYLNTEPYSRYVFSLAPYGTIPVTGTFQTSTGRSFLLAEEYIDCITGESVLTLYSVESLTAVSFKTPLGRFSAKLGVDIKMAQSADNYLPAIGAAANAISSIATGNISGAVTGTFSAIESAASASSASVATSGTNGSFAELLSVYTGKAYLTGTFSNVAEEDNGNFGSPLCNIRKVSDIPGFIMCSKPKLDMPCYPEEMDSVLSYMEKGFYYE